MLMAGWWWATLQAAMYSYRLGLLLEGTATDELEHSLEDCCGVSASG